MAQDDEIAIGSFGCSRAKALLVALGLAAVIGGVAGVYHLGCPSWHSSIYIYQRYYLGNIPEVPVDFTGVWRIWYEDGTLQAEEEYIAGNPSGSLKTWDPKGNLISHCVRGKRGTTGSYLLGGLKYFIDGKCVDEEEYARYIDEHPSFPPLIIQFGDAAKPERRKPPKPIAPKMSPEPED